MPPQSQTPQNLSTMNDFFDIDDDFDNEFTNSLFDSLNAPFLFPNPKESGTIFIQMFIFCYKLYGKSIFSFYSSMW